MIDFKTSLQCLISATGTGFIKVKVNVRLRFTGRLISLVVFKSCENTLVFLIFQIFNKKFSLLRTYLHVKVQVIGQVKARQLSLLVTLIVNLSLKLLALFFLAGLLLYLRVSYFLSLKRQQGSCFDVVRCYQTQQLSAFHFII